MPVLHTGGLLGYVRPPLGDMSQPRHASLLEGGKHGDLPLYQAMCYWYEVSPGDAEDAPQASYVEGVEFMLLTGA